jgi:hypothetical protein
VGGVAGPVGVGARRCRPGGRDLGVVAVHGVVAGEAQVKDRPARRTCRRPRYATAELAMAALAAARRTGATARRWYWCERCKHFHLEEKGTGHDHLR